MSRSIQVRHLGMSVTTPIYTDAEIKKAWVSYGQGSRQAEARGTHCVVVPCDEEAAVALTREFLDHFNIPTCCHYDGNTLSMYCGDAGRGADSLFDKMSRVRVSGGRE